MMSSQSLLEGLIDKKVERILKKLFESEDELFHINKLSKSSNVPLASTFRIIRRLVSLDIITPVQIGKFRIYKLNSNKKTKLLKELIHQ